MISQETIDAVRDAENVRMPIPGCDYCGEDGTNSVVITYYEFNYCLKCMKKVFDKVLGDPNNK